MASSCAAPYERSITRPSRTRFPRSVTFTTTERWLTRFMTRTIVPNGRVGWQAVMAYMSYTLPLAVILPSNLPPYHEATPWSLYLLCPLPMAGARDGGVAFAAKVATGDVKAGRGRRVSACTIRVDITKTTAASATDETPASSDSRRDVFKVRNWSVLAICLFYQLAIFLDAYWRVRQWFPVEKIGVGSGSGITFFIRLIYRLHRKWCNFPLWNPVAISITYLRCWGNQMLQRIIGKPPFRVRENAQYLIAQMRLSF